MRQASVYTLKGLAAETGVSYGYLKHLMIKVRRGEVTTWRGFRFVGLGSGKRAVWFVVPEDSQIAFITGPDEPTIGDLKHDTSQSQED